MPEGCLEPCTQLRICKHRRSECESGLPSLTDIEPQLFQHLGIEIENPPGARAIPDGAPIVHFTGIRTDEASRTGLHLSASAPRGMAASIDETDAIRRNAHSQLSALTMT
jgi:hypothetical protein